MSIRDLVRDRILNDVLGKFSNDNSWKILIVDDETLGLISAACRVRDIMQKNITIVENIRLKRQPFPQLSAIYLIAPRRDPIEKLIADFSGPKPLYQSAHLFFTSRLPTKLMKLIQDSTKALGSIKTFVELNLDFLAIEPNVYSLNHADDMEVLYGENATGQKENVAELLANQLLTVCVTLGEMPFIRYKKSQEICTLLGNSLQKKLTKFKAKNKEVKMNQDSVMVIMDRSSDCLAPLLHEFTYQCMTFDLKKIGSDGVYEYQYSDGDTSKKKKIIFDEYDNLWVKYRHMHIDQTLKKLHAEFNEFISEHKDIGRLRGKEAKEKAAKDTKALTTMIGKLPQYQDMLGKYSLHLTLVKDLMDIFKKEQLNKVAMQEQNMAVGKDPEGKTVTGEQILTNISPILRDDSLPMELKLRLVMIYLISQGGVKDEKRSKLMKMAKFDAKDEATINSLACLGVQLTKSTSIASTISTMFKGLKKGKTVEVDYDLSRYVSKLKEVSQDILKSSLSQSEYPYAGTPPSSSFKLVDPKASKTAEAKNENAEESLSLRSRNKPNNIRSRGSKPAWESGSDPSSSSSGPKSRKKLIIFMIGGMTHSEMRTAYELSEEFQLDVYVGSTSILTPELFIKKLSSLKKGNAYDTSI